jgi:putative ABC transport system permease protein
VIHALDKGLPVSRIVPLTEYVHAAVATRRFAASLSGSFALLALLLAAVGIYGTVVHNVARRTHEFGVRMVLGAKRGAVLRMVLRQGLVPVAIGLAIGTAGAWAVTREITSELFGITPTDPATFIGVAILLALVALAASYVPARRAMRVDPMVALRYD